MISNLPVYQSVSARADVQRWIPQKALVGARPLPTTFRHCDLGTRLLSQKSRVRTEFVHEVVRCCGGGAAAARDGNQGNSRSVRGDSSQGNPKDGRPARGDRANAAPAAAAAVPVEEGVPSSLERGHPYSAREAHNEAQSAFFDEAAVDYFVEPLPADVEAKLARIVASARLRPNCQVLDAGCGSGPLISHLIRAGVAESSIVAVDVSPVMLALLKERFDDVTCWLGDVARMPDGFARGHDTARLLEPDAASDDVCVWPCFDAVFFNAMFGNVFDQAETLRSVARQCAVGARVVISHPLGRSFVRELHRGNPSLVPHELPDERQLAALLEGLPLRVDSYVDEPDFYVAVLERLDEPPAAAARRARRHSTSGNAQAGESPASNAAAEGDAVGTFTSCRPGGSTQECAQEIYERLVGSVAAPRFYDRPVFVEGPVVSGFQRGSKEMGIPTANLPPEQLTDALRGLDKGVYYGFAQLQPLQEQAQPPQQEGVEAREGAWSQGSVPAGRGDLDVHEMVLNIGDRPTFAGQGVSVEAHILHKYASDFYGRHLKVMLLGFVRAERRFSSPADLIAQIQADIAVSKDRLATPECAVWKESDYFSH